ncbi:hypothetical protein [Geoglobus acetivorans]|uniref:DoxX family protein n=1 Tax=Geoglobus acetivorans TaxID=565033 RepID=A0ABZ3H5Z9_GEOAI|nr:hypothetical protein [Geoglobus acetivorans]
MSVYKPLTYLVVFILMVWSAGRIIIAFTNPESYFIGFKLGGLPAAVHLLISGLVGIVLVYMLLRGLKVGIIVSIAYFGYNFVESGMSSLLLHGELSFSYISALGLFLSTILLSQKR